MLDHVIPLDGHHPLRLLREEVNYSHHDGFMMRWKKIRREGGESSNDPQRPRD